MDEEKENKPDKVIKIKVPKFTKKFRENPWIVSTFVMIVLAIVLVVNGSGNGITGHAISGDDAGQILLDFYEAGGADGLSLKSVEEVSGVYQVNFEYQGAIVSVYVTKDGKLAGSMAPLLFEEEFVAEPESSDVVKSDKPILEAFVSPYCPYGLQYMKGLIPVYSLLKDKADINIKHIGITHMALEESETMRQLCILNEYGKNELFAYLENIIYTKEAEVCYNDWHSGEFARDDEHFTGCMKPLITKALKNIGVDENKINNCIQDKGEDYFNSAVEYAHSQNVHSSPTSKVNGAKVSGRSPELIKNAICNAFNERPEECSTELSSSTPSPGMGGESGADTQAQC